MLCSDMLSENERSITLPGNIFSGIVSTYSCMRKEAMEQGKSIHLGLLLHNHQPVGNFPWVFQQVYEEAYLPMIEALERHPKIRLSLHYTGSLLDWLEEAHPEFLVRIANLIKRKQIEPVSGGYYEPILPSIPDRDKVAQILRLT